jgi:hypothetical protein
MRGSHKLTYVFLDDQLEGDHLPARFLPALAHKVEDSVKSAFALAYRVLEYRSVQFSLLYKLKSAGNSVDGLYARVYRRDDAGGTGELPYGGVADIYRDEVDNLLICSCRSCLNFLYPMGQV